MARRSRFAADRGLVARMVVTMFLLGLLYVAFVAVLLAVRVPWFLVLAVVLGFFAFQFFFSDRVALFAMRGRVVDAGQAPDLHAAIDRLCALSDMPKPTVAIADSDVPNAFATGRSPRRAVLCVTTGLQRRLEPHELEGVLAHELSHVAHKDVAVMTIASFLGVLAGLVTRVVLYSGLGWRGGGRNQQVFVVLAVVTLASVVTYAISFLLVRALSRYRELAADRSGALLTGQPSALASALTKISGQMATIPRRDLRAAEPFNAFFFAPAFAKGLSVSTLLATHPPLQQRVDQLGQISAELGHGG